MWGDAQYTELSERVHNVRIRYGVANTSEDSTVTEMPENKFKGKKVIAKKALKEEIASMAILK